MLDLHLYKKRPYMVVTRLADCSVKIKSWMSTGNVMINKQPFIKPLMLVTKLS